MKIFLFISILIFSLTCFAQVEITSYEKNLLDKTEAEISVLQYDDFTSEGLKSSNLEVSKFAKNLHQRLLVSVEDRYNKLIDTLPNTKLRNRFNYIIAELYDRQGEVKNAKELYQQVLSNPQNLLLWSQNAENYTRRSINIRLAEIEIAETQYESALKHLDLAKKIEIKYICGNAIQSDYERFKNLNQICNDGIKNRK